MRAPSLLLTAATAAITLASCTAGIFDEAGAPPKPLVLTTFTVIEDIAENIAGDHLQVESITKPGAEIHDYEPTPSDLKQAANAELILNNGLGLERWFEKFTADSNAKRVDLSDGIEPIEIAGGEYSGKPNPHAWMSPQNGQVYVDNIVKAFSEIDPDHAADYAKNGAAYKQQLQKLSDKLITELATLPPTLRTLVSCEGAFSYLAREANLNELYLWPVNAEQEGTPQQISHLEQQVRETKVPTVFCESTVNTKAMQQVAEATGATFHADAQHLLYVDSLSASDGPVPSYIKLLEHDVNTITAGLKEGKKA